MADRGDAELIRSIGSIVGDVAGMFQATPQELQAARLAADESSEARTMAFTERMKQVDYNNELMANEIERRGNMYADNLNLIRTAELDLAKANVNYEAYVSKNEVTQDQNNLFETMDKKKRNALGITELQLQDQEQELQYLMGALQHDLQLKDDAERDLEFFGNLDVDGKEGVLEDSEIEQLRAKYQVDETDADGNLVGMSTEEFDERIGYIKNAELDYWENAGKKTEVIGDRLDNEGKRLENKAAQAALDKVEKDKKITAEGYILEENKSDHVTNNGKAYAYDLNLEDEDRQEELNTIINDIRQTFKKDADPYLIAEGIRRKATSIFNDPNLGDMELTDTMVQEFWDSDSPGDYIDDHPLDFNRLGEDKADNKKIKELLVSLHTLNAEIVDRPMTDEEKLADAKRVADNKKQNDLDRNPASLTKITGANVLSGINTGRLSDAIAHAEGSLTKGTRGYRNNNPHNLKFAGQPGATKDKDGFAVFATAEEGRAAGIRQIKKTMKDDGVTLEEALTKWTPPSENDTVSYIDTVLNQYNSTIKEKPAEVKKKSAQSLNSYMVERLTGENPEEFINEKVSNIKKWWASSPNWAGVKKNTPEWKRVDDLMKDYIKSKQVVENYVKKTGKPATKNMRDALLRKQAELNKSRKG
ncbi:MAG: hypothetical protein HOG49_00835 [Candidatus Scalindua sp.]|nr:hypothetical protein [Candidatus Scalindua sp.]